MFHYVLMVLNTETEVIVPLKRTVHFQERRFFQSTNNQFFETWAAIGNWRQDLDGLSGVSLGSLTHPCSKSSGALFMTTQSPDVMAVQPWSCFCLILAGYLRNPCLKECNSVCVSCCCCWRCCCWWCCVQLLNLRQTLIKILLLLRIFLDNPFNKLGHPLDMTKHWHSQKLFRQEKIVFVSFGMQFFTLSYFSVSVLTFHIETVQTVLRIIEAPKSRPGGGGGACQEVMFLL